MLDNDRFRRNVYVSVHLRFKVLCHLFLLVRWAEDLRPFRIKAWGQQPDGYGKMYEPEVRLFPANQAGKRRMLCTWEVGSVEVINSFNMLWYTYHRYRRFLVHRMCYNIVTKGKHSKAISILHIFSSADLCKRENFLLSRPHLRNFNFYMLW